MLSVKVWTSARTASRPTSCNPVLKRALPTALRGRWFSAHPYPAGGGGGVGVLAVGGITAALAIADAVGARAVAVVELHRGIVRFGAGRDEVVHGRDLGWLVWYQCITPA